MSSSAPAIWSAVAASFSALASLLIMLIHRRNLLESARPELALEGWSRETSVLSGVKRDSIFFPRVRNVGRGVALHVIVIPEAGTKPKATHFVSGGRVAIVPPNEGADIGGEVAIWWPNIKLQTQEGRKYLGASIVLYCWDTRGYRHEVTYRVFVAEHRADFGRSGEIAPGVTLSTRTTVARPVWRLKLSKWCRKTWHRVRKVLRLEGRKPKQAPEAPPDEGKP